MATPPPGWYPDPWNPVALRWWDGQTWTPHWAQPQPAALPPRTFPAAAARVGLVGLVVTVVGARVVTTVMLNGLSVPAELYVASFYTMVFGGLWLTISVASRRYGTGHAFHDFGLVWQWRDIWRGIGLFFLGRIAQIIALLPWANHLSRLQRLTEGLSHVSLATFLVFAVSAVIGAPILEELMFRGVLQQSFAEKIGQGRAVMVQGALFGLYHVTPGLGGSNIPYALSLAAAGWVLGWGALRWRRLGPTSTAHFLVNAVSVSVLFTQR